MNNKTTLIEGIAKLNDIIDLHEDDIRRSKKCCL